MTIKRKRRRDRLAKPVHAPRGIMARYRQELDALINAHREQLITAARAAYRTTPPAADSADPPTPYERMRERLNSLTARAQEEFDRRAEVIATRYIRRTFRWSEQRLKRNLLDAGMPQVRYSDSEAWRDALAASIGENVALIKSIPQQLHEKIEGMVGRAFARGSDWGSLYEGLRHAFKVTHSRAKLISGDQIAKATGNVVRLRQMELGIKRAKWMHSGGGKKPRPDHVAANGKIFDVEKGCKISGEYILPGQLINCRCTSRAVLPIDDD